MSRISGFIDRARGTGRPTKKDRRSLAELFTPDYFYVFDFGLEDESNDKEEQ